MSTNVPRTRPKADPPPGFPPGAAIPVQSVGGKQLVGQCAAFRHVIEQVRNVAPLDVNALLTGERGTGKSVIAEVIHNLSPRSAVPFQQINCAAMPEELIERMLFGSVKGAYTGAGDAKGLFEAAAGGTLFLDEIGDASPALQAKLLRAIETKAVTRLGSHRPTDCDVRLVFATNKELSTLRPDFVDRIDEAQIHVPPLRERREDLPALIRYNFDRMQAKFPNRRTPYELDPVALKVLCEYSWPGNIRQLGSVVLKVALMCMNTGTVMPSDVGAVLRRRATDNPPSPSV
ncbi:MAG TPA: sigma 54-interacting transcriptional regulator, partial [Pyrinomonadaceae bacterium]